MAHTRPSTTILALSLTLLFSAGAVAQNQKLTADEKELSTYRLTMPTVKKVMGVLQAFVEEISKDPKVQEQQKLEAQIKALETKEELTEAQEAQLEKLRERAEALEEEIDRLQEASGMQNPETIDQMEAAMKKHPAGMRALASQGLSAREYSKAMLALLQASLAEGFLQGQDLSKLPAGINPENVKFVRENKDALAAMQSSLKKPGK